MTLCDICQKQLKNAAGVRLHKLRMHTDATQHKSSLGCNPKEESIVDADGATSVTFDEAETFSVDSEDSIRLNTSLPKSKGVSCEICSKSCKNKSGLRLHHLNTHNKHM